MILWRIHTERKNVENVAIACNTFLPTGFTLLSGIGYWQGKKEETLVIEYIGVGLDEERINSLARTIKTCNEQEAILVTATELIGYKLIS